MRLLPHRAAMIRIPTPPPPSELSPVTKVIRICSLEERPPCHVVDARDSVCARATARVSAAYVQSGKS